MTRLLEKFLSSGQILCAVLNKILEPGQEPTGVVELVTNDVGISLAMLNLNDISLFQHGGLSLV